MKRKLKAGDIIYEDDKGRLSCINRNAFDGWWFVKVDEKLTSSFWSYLWCKFLCIFCR